MEISAYKETGTFIMKSNEETGQMLDDHIVMTQAMSFSPYKKPFEGRITTWENKLRTTQVSMLNVHVFQGFLLLSTTRLRITVVSYVNVQVA